MKNRFFARRIVGASLALILGVAWVGHCAARRTETARAELRARSAGLTSRLQKARDRIMAAERDRTSFLRRADELRSRQAAAQRASNRLKFPAVLAGNPKLFRLWLQTFRAGLARRFGPFYQNLDLSDAARGKFEDILTEHEARGMELKATALAQGLEASDPAILALRQTEDARFDSAEAALLGEEGYAELREFKRQQPVQPMVDSVAFAVALSPTPLSGDQAEELAGVLANAQSQYQNEGTAGSDIMKIDWDTALAQASGILSERQFAVLQADAQFVRLRQWVAEFHRQQAEK